MPAIIRREQNQVVTRAVAPRAVAAPQSAAGALASGFQNVAASLENIEDTYATGDAKMADAQFSDLIQRELYDETSGFMYSQGGDAMSRRESVAQRIRDARQEIAGGLSANALAKAQSSLDRHFDTALQKINIHTVAQRNSYLDNAAAARITSATNNAIFDPDQVAQSLSINRQEILDMASRNGWSPEQTQLKLDESATAIHSGVVERIALADPTVALEYLQNNKDKMQGGTVAKLEARLVPIVRERVGRQKGRAAAMSWGQVPDGFDWSKHTAHGGRRPDAITGLDGNFEVGLANMIASAPAEIRDGLQVFSGFRSEERQRQLWSAALKKYGSAAEARKWVAPPGNSNHNHGKAADLQWKGERLDRAPDHVRKWVHQNAKEFGLHFPLGNEPWHVEMAGTRGTAPFQAPVSGFETLLDIEDPDEREAAISEYNLFVGMQTAQRKSAAASASQAAFDLIESGGNVNDLSLEHRQFLGREEMSALRSYQEKLASGESITTDDQVYVDLMDLMSTNPRAFMEANPITWRPRLSNTHFQYFVQKQGELKSGARTAVSSAPTVSTLRTAAVTALKAAGIDRPAQVMAFESDLLRWSASFTEENNAPPSPIEINDRINQMLVPVTINPVGTSPGVSGLLWDFGKQDGAAFEIDYDGNALDPHDDLQPSDVRDGRLTINGQKVSNEIIESFANLYEASIRRPPSVRELVEGIISEGLYE